MGNNTGFFPTADYKVPQTSNYLKLQEGENTFRVLSSAIVGYEYFNVDNKPVRSRENFDTVPSDIKKDGRVNHFWAFLVWNYDTKSIQIAEITQKSIQGAMQALIKNVKWGNPKNYDITITRKGSGMDTEYTVMPNPSTQLPKEVQDKVAKVKVNLEALYEGNDPFKS